MNALLFLRLLRLFRRRFPNGLREVTDHARKKGLKNILWFEIERARGDTWLAKKHPEWLLSTPAAAGSSAGD